MKLTKAKDGSVERLILTGMITNRRVLAAIASRWDERGLFPDKFGNLIGSWCVGHYEKYGIPPGPTIQTKFEKWAVKTKDETAEVVGKFLARLSNEYETRKKAIKADYVIDEAQDLFKKAQVRLLREELEELEDAGDIKKALEQIRSFDEIQIDTQAGIDVFSDLAAVKNATENPEADILIRYPGAVGNFFEDTFSRGHLVSYMGPEKSGKTFRLIDTTYMGIEQGCTVAFFAVGDMNQKQMMRRFLARVCKRPFKPSKFKYPVDFEPGDPPQPALETAEYKNYLPYDLAEKKFKKFVTKFGANRLKLFTYPNSSISINGVKSVLLTERRRGWVPDIVVIDYADILAPLNGTAETRDQINSTWKGLKALSHEMLVVTATQSNAASYSAEVLGKINFAEDKRKLAHTNAIIGINSTETEKTLGVSRLNYIVARENEFVETKCVWCAGSLSLCAPIMFSSF